MSLQLQTLSAPNVALASAVKANPHVPTLAQDFARISKDLLTTVRKQLGGLGLRGQVLGDQQGRGRWGWAKG